MRLLAPLIAVLSAPALAGAQQIAQVTDQVPIAAHDGWVVWGVKEAGRYRLVSWHDGVTKEMGLRGRPRPFDVDVGTDARGRDVATFSRCRRFRTVQVWEATGRQVGVGCRVRVVDLETGRERSAGVPGRRGGSDTMPSMWQGRIAFARRQPSTHGNVDQVMLWSPRNHALTRLRHGAMPATCPFRDKRICGTAQRSGEVTGLDLGARMVAFTWQVRAPAVIGHGGYEVRADRLSDGRSALIGSGYIGEACTGGIDGTSPGRPSVQGDSVWYSQTATDCYRVTARLNVYRGFPVRGRRGALAGIALQTTGDGSNLYALVVPPNAPNEGPACTPCTIERIAIPALAPIRLRPHSPFA